MAESTTLQPTGLAAAILGITIFLIFASTTSVLLRIYVRLKIKSFGLDDYLMVVGWAFFLACATFTCMDTVSGLGTVDDNIMAASPSGYITMNGYKWFFFFQVTYVWTLPFIKASICVALLRISQARRYRYPLWAIIIVSSGTAFAGFIGALLNCHPIAAGWNSTLGSCDATGRIQTLSEVISAAAIVTDWACAIIPAFLIWGLNMKKKQKLTLCGILALGVIASISTIVRFPYLRFYAITTDQLYEFGNVVLWTMIECGLGITAGSLPTLRPLLRRFGASSNDKSYGDTSNHPKSNGRSIGLSAIRGHTTVTSQNNPDHWERIDDSSSQKFIIKKNTQIDVEWQSQKNEGASASDGRSF
ncbi:hypothetical protein BX600DRAFT_439007 [Xylariales sp. PMI_506]|nr:hypothetical protein BX600DRAFT_439007 [Xylariales sp. PMI_506]